jgi:PAS domain S-box-containing protein
MTSQRRQLSVRAKLFIFLCAVSLLPLLLSSRVLILLGTSGFHNIRESQVRDGSAQALRSFQMAAKNLLEAVEGVAGWEDLANFFDHPDPAWGEGNLAGWAPQSYQLDFLALCDPRGEVLYHWHRREEYDISPLLKLDSLPDSIASGWITTPHDLYLTARSQVLTSNSRQIGILVFGRRLTHSFLRSIHTDDHSNLLVYYGGRPLATTDTSNVMLKIDPGEIFSEMVSRDGTYLFEAHDQDRLIGFRGLKNMDGVEVAAVGWYPSLSPARFVKEVVDQILLYFGIPLLAIVLLAALILGLWIERPIRTLSKTMEGISETKDLSQRVPVAGGGEISSMSNSFNRMLQQLSEQHNELLTFRTMILAMKEGVIVENARQEVVYMNPRMEEILGISWESDEYRALPFKLEGLITAKGSHIEGATGFSTEEVEWIRPDGRRIQALKTSGRLEDPLGNETGVLSTFVDVTERNDLEMELIEASRMAFLGLYSQGIIHNLNSPLNSIIGFSSLMRRNAPDAEFPQRITDDAKRIADQISILGRRWRRTGTSSHEALNLNEIIQDELQFLDADLFYKHNVNKHFELDPDLPTIQGVYGDFSHALLNIIVNAIDALLESPNHELTVRTSHDEFEIRLEIEDTGVGISQEDLNKIFIPFYSTKRRNRDDGIPSGAGLGLSIARKVLEPYGVRFAVHSELGEGTRLTLHIPLENNAELVIMEEVCEEHA